MKIMAACAGIIILAITISACGNSEPDGRSDLSPQVRVMYSFLKAVKTGDMNGLKSVFSARMKVKHSGNGWIKTMKAYQEVLKHDYGEDYRLEKFRFSFKGDDKRGVVIVSYPGRDSGGIRIIREAGEWKMDEN